MEIKLMNVPENMVQYLSNQYVEKITGKGDIRYTRNFYSAMAEIITEEQKTYTEAYRALGFSVEELGIGRAENAGKRAMQMYREGRLDTGNPENYDGRKAEMNMGKLTLKEEWAYLKSRTAFLEHTLAIQERIRNVLKEPEPQT